MSTLKRKRGKRKNKTMKKGGKKKGPNKVFISAREMEKKISLSCPVCNNNKFFVKQSMIRGGRAASFFATEWIFDKYSRITICSKCSNVQWFRDKKAVEEQDN
tara:strand:- start:1051 stop:1359 length:309 start_codon:yes stop_codon:yes gene_type:complete